jgi:hypothetical protein
MFRYALMAVLAMGVVGGYGSAVARVAYWRTHGGCHSAGGWHESRWQDRWGPRGDERAEVKQQAPAPQPQTVVVQPAAAAPAPAPNVFVIMPGAQPTQPQTVVVPALAVPAVAQQAAPVVAPSPAQPQ